MSLLLIFLAGVLLSGVVMCAPLVERSAETGWSQVVRLRHLYAARTGLHLQISADGGVHGSVHQSPYTLLEITAVSPGCVALRGVTSDRYLCMREDATLYTLVTYSRDKCTFTEQILPDGYSVFSSQGQLLSLGNPRQRQRGRDRGAPALAQFLPRLSTLDLTIHPASPGTPPSSPTQHPLDHMDSFGRLSQIIHSPSFHER